MRSVEIRFVLLSRVNPVLPPRRRKATAERHAQAAERVSYAVAQLDHDEQRRWAARCMLDSASAIPLPHGYPRASFDGSGRQYARDEGGIEGQYLLRLARYIILHEHHADQAMVTAWSILYPHSAFGHAAAMLSEWELYYRREELAGELEEDRLFGGHLAVIDSDNHLYRCGPFTDSWSLYREAPFAVIDNSGTIVGYTFDHPCETWMSRQGVRMERRDLVENGMSAEWSTSSWQDDLGGEWFREVDGSQSGLADEPLPVDATKEEWEQFCSEVN